MGGSGNMVVSLVLLFVATLVAVVYLKSESRSIESSQIVQLPQIGGSGLARGPWPGCLGIQGTECKDQIESYASDTKGHVEIITPDMVDQLPNDFSPIRVRIYVDDDGVVTQIPVRGR